MATIKEFNDIRAVVEAALREDCERELADALHRLDALESEAAHAAKALRVFVRDEKHYSYQQILGLVTYTAGQLEEAVSKSQFNKLSSPDYIPF